MAVIDDRRRRRGDFSPAALDGLLLAMTADPGYVFQDSAGTTAAVSHGDPGGLTPHRFGGSLNPSQSTDAVRPTLDIALGNGRGPEQVVNGAFDQNIDGWTLIGGTINHDATNGGRARLLKAGGGGNVRAGASLGVITAGTVIEISADFVRGAGSSASFLRLSSDGGNFSNDLGVQISSSDAQGTLTATYTATSTVEVFIVIVGGVTNGDEVFFDNVSSREVLRDGPRGIRFNGTSQFLDATGLTAASGPKTVIAGCITDGGEGGANEFLFDARVGRVLSAAVGSSSGEAGMYDGSWTSGGDYNAEALSVLTFRHYATNGGIRANGAEILTENVVEKPFGGEVTVGANFSVSGGFLDGVIYALLVFDRALTTKEIQLCEAWVAARQGRIL